MNAIVKQESRLPAMQMNESDLMEVLQSSLYPGASPNSIKMVLGYCKASGLDPMQKPVHLVPMWDNKSGTMRDVVMPGIGLYRTQAARTGCAGISEPEFGSDVTETVGGQSITYPVWCKVTVKRRLETGDIVEFTAKEFWKENYAVKGGKEKSVAPNAMWAKRPYGQLAKCAEAQALRKAFPEIGSEPTADEVIGKTLNEEFEPAAKVIDPATGEIAPKTLPPYPDPKFAKALPNWSKSVSEGGKVSDLLAMLQSKYTLSAEQLAQINALDKPAEAPAEMVDEFVAALGD